MSYAQNKIYGYYIIILNSKEEHQSTEDAQQGTRLDMSYFRDYLMLYSE